MSLHYVLFFKWCPSEAETSLNRADIAFNALVTILWGIFWHSSQIIFLSSARQLHGLFSALPFKHPHNQKSQGAQSGDDGSHSSLVMYLTCHFSRYSLVFRDACAGAESWCQKILFRIQFLTCIESRFKNGVNITVGVDLYTTFTNYGSNYSRKGKSAQGYRWQKITCKKEEIKRHRLVEEVKKQKELIKFARGLGKGGQVINKLDLLTCAWSEYGFWFFKDATVTPMFVKEIDVMIESFCTRNQFPCISFFNFFLRILGILKSFGFKIFKGCLHREQLKKYFFH